MAQFISYSQASTPTTTTSLTLNLPTSTQSGDLLIAHMLTHGSSTITAPSGWTLLSGPTLYADSYSSVYYKNATTSEPATYTFTMTSTSANSGAIFTFRNANIQTQAYTSTGSSTSSTSMTAPSISPTNPGLLLTLYALHYYGTSTVTTDPAGMTKIFAVNNNTGYIVQAAYWQSIPAGATGTRVAVNSTSGGNIGTSIAIGTVNNPPNTPANTTPGGTQQAPVLVKTLNPTLSWTFSDPEAGQTQSAYQVFAYDGNGNSFAQSAIVSSSATSVTSSQLGLTLYPDTTYGWSVVTWDNGAIPQMSAASPTVYFKTSKVPTATSLSPANGVTTSTLTPHLTWVYADGDGDPQASYQVTIQNATTQQTVYDSGQVASSSPYHDVPAGNLLAGTDYKWNLTVWDTTGMTSNLVSTTFHTNNPPGTVTLVSPGENVRFSNSNPAFVATIGNDIENDKQNFKIQLAYDSNFTNMYWEDSTLSPRFVWEAFNGTSWVSITSSGVDSSFEGKQVRVTLPMTIIEKKTLYWRMSAIDATTGAMGPWSATRTVRMGNTLQFKLRNPVITPTSIQKIVITGNYKLATDGTTPATLKVEVCNNGLDSTPNWEDATNAFLNGLSFSLTNTTKSSANWAVDCRVTIVANDSMNPIEFDGIGFAF